MFPVVKNEPYDWSLGSAHHPIPALPSTPIFPTYSNATQPLELKRKHDDTNGGPYFQPSSIKNEKLDIKPITAIKKEQSSQPLIKDMLPVVKKKRDRFKGLSEEQVLLRRLPDLMVPGLDIIIVGINPGLTAAYLGHHYAGPGNHFWKCLFMSGLINEPLTAYDDERLKDFGIGFTNIVARTTRGSADLTKKEIQQGSEILREKICKFKPKIAVFNGKGIYEVFSASKKFDIGLQPSPFPGTECLLYVMPSSSARCSQLPRAIDKVPFYVGLKALRDHVRGDRVLSDMKEIIFPDVDLKVKPRDPNAEKKPRAKRIKTVKTEIKTEIKSEVKTEPLAPPLAHQLAPPLSHHLTPHHPTIEAPSIEQFAMMKQMPMISDIPSTSSDSLTSGQSPYFSPFSNYAAFKAEPGETINSIFSHSPYFSPPPPTPGAPPSCAAIVGSSQTAAPSAAATSAVATAAQFMHPWFNQYAASGGVNHNQQ